MEPNLPFDGGQKKTFFAPSGFQYTIREQNGADDDILSNFEEAKTLKNLARFVASIVINTNAHPSGKLTTEQAYNLPSLDVYTILIQSRIHSMGSDLEFVYNWPTNGGKTQEVNYLVDLNQFIFSTYNPDDMSDEQFEEEIASKPDAIPFYPRIEEGFFITGITTSGKEYKFDFLTLKSEAYLVGLPISKQTRNQDLVARNLSLKDSKGEWQKVITFSCFTKRDLNEIRTEVMKCDPTFTGNTVINNPDTGKEATISILGINDFFFPGEI